MLEERMMRRGYLEGTEMATTFNMLRANDLIWSFVVNNYLLGKEPFPFDLLYWNSDATRMPPTMHSFYLRNMYQKNLLAQPGGLTMKACRSTCAQSTSRAYFLSCREDHIAPWKSLMRRRSCSGGSALRARRLRPYRRRGQPAGRRQVQPFHQRPLPDTADAWFEGATEVAGSWWPDWQHWVTGLDHETVPARIPGKGLKAIEPAPGSYVTVRS